MRELRLEAQVNGDDERVLNGQNKDELVPALLPAIFEGDDVLFRNSQVLANSVLPFYVFLASLAL